MKHDGLPSRNRGPQTFGKGRGVYLGENRDHFSCQFVKLGDLFSELLLRHRYQGRRLRGKRDFSEVRFLFQNLVQRLNIVRIHDRWKLRITNKRVGHSESHNRVF